MAANLGHKAKTGLRTLKEFTEKINMRNVDMVFCSQTTVGDDKKQRYHSCRVLKKTLTMSVKMKLRVCCDVDSKMLFGSMLVIAGVILQPRETGPVGGVIRAMMERADDDEAEAVQSAAEELEVYCNLTGQECDSFRTTSSHPHLGKVISYHAI